MTLPVVILAGGRATRLRPLTQSIPKAMVEVNGEPFIRHQIALLHSRGVRQVVVCAGYRGEMIRDFLRDGGQFGVHAKVVFDGEPLLGTAGAIKKALPDLDKAFFVLYGDSYLPCDYRAVQKAFESSGKRALMTVFHNCGQWDPSNVEFVDGKILRYEKGTHDPRMKHIDYGLGVLSAAAFEGVPDNEPYDLAELYRQLLLQDQLAGCIVRERFYEMGSFAGLEELRRKLAAAA